MAFNFDPDAFVRGATGAADLYNKLTFEPEQQRQALETQRLQQQAYKNQIATSEFDLAQKQGEAERAATRRNIGSQRVQIANVGEQLRGMTNEYTNILNNNINEAITSNDPVIVAKKGLTAGTGGTIAAVSYDPANKGMAVVQEAEKVMQDFGYLLNNPKSGTPEAINSVADRGAKVLAKFSRKGSGLEPENAVGRYEDGMFVVYAKQPDGSLKEVERDHPIEFAKKFQQGAKMLKAYSRGLLAADADAGGEASKEYVERAERNTDAENAINTFMSPEAKALGTSALSLNKEGYTAFMNKALEIEFKTRESRSGREKTALVDPIVAEVKKLLPKGTESQKMSALFNMDSQISDIINTKYPELKDTWATKFNDGSSPLDAVKAAIGTNLSMVETQKTISEAAHKEAENVYKDRAGRAALISAEAAARAAGTKAGANTESSENIKITLDSYVKELAALEANPVSDKNRKAFLVKEIDTLREALKGATRTPSGKKAEAALPKPQGKFGTLTDAQLTQLLNKL